MYSDYDSTLKKQGVLPDAITWMNIKDIMLSENSKSQKDKYYDFTYRRYLK